MSILTREEYRACVDAAILWQRIDWRNNALRSMQKLLKEERIKSFVIRRELEEIKDDINSETLSALRKDSTPQNHQLINLRIGCAACDRGDFQLGHHHNCPLR